ncbi:MAG: hypothetical protein R3250_13455, partial [Melioribacteraceae bacterium]|nr:hypothetical protein [Melioribacteraceae bacterium]
MDYQKIITKLEKDYDRFILDIYLSFDVHIHGNTINGGVYHISQNDDDIVVIAFNKPKKCFWGFPMAYVENDKLIFREEVGMNTYTDCDIVLTIKEPQNITFDILQCFIHTRQETTVCDICDQNILKYRKNYYCKYCEY